MELTSKTRRYPAPHAEFLSLFKSMKPRIPLLLLLSTVVPLAAQTKKNILLIAVDDLKPNIGAYGDTIAKTPNIDRLAARGLRFDRAYTNQALCSPSRNALMVGIRPGSLGIYDLATNFRKAAPDAVTLPQYFIQHGYRAENLGKIYHIGQGNQDDAASWSVPRAQLPAQTYALEANRPPQSGGQERDPLRNRGAATESADVSDDTYIDGKIADEAIRRLEAAKQREGTPFFLATGFIRPHLPFVAPKKYWDLYDRTKLKLPELRKPPEGSPAAATRPNGELAAYKDTKDANSLSEEKQLELLHGYYAAASYTDTQIGKVLDALDRLGLTDSTIVILWGDHGWHLGDHGYWGKFTNYEQATRIPFIIAAPGVTKPGSHTTSLAQSVDLYPTLVELNGLPAPQTSPSLEGKSLVPVLKDPAATVHDGVLQVVPRQGVIGRSLRTSTHRLVEWKKPGATEGAEFELYDYVKDPLETKNLATEQAELVTTLRGKLAAYPEAKPSIASPTPPSQGQDRARLFANRDKDGDGKLSRDEFLANQRDGTAAAGRFTRFDKDGDSSLSKDEFISAGK